MLFRSRTDPDGLSETYEYDLTGKAWIKKTDRAGRVTSNSMNVFEKPILTVHPDGTTERFEYSAKGELIASVDQAGNPTYYRYDAAGNMTAKWELIRKAGAGSEYRLKTMTYDEANRPIASETFLATAAGRPTIASQDAVSAKDRVVYRYDKAGRTVAIYGPGERETLHAYDQAGNLIKTHRKAGEGLDEIIRYTYDSRSRKISEILLVHTSDVANSQLAGAVFDKEYADRIHAATVYGYDANGNVTSVKDPNGRTTRYEYDYDNRVTRKTDPADGETRYRYDAFGNLTQETNANGIATRYEYDELNRVIRKIEPSAGSASATTRYVYDAAGNLIKQIEPNEYEPASDTPSGLSEMAGLVYTYDAMNRRTSTISPDGELIEAIAYDAKGRVRKVADGLRYNGNIDASSGTIYAYDGLGRVVKETDALGHSVAYEYDALDHVTRQTDRRGYVTEYAYNPDGTLARVAYPDGTSIRYTYDRLGRMQIGRASCRERV